MVDVRRFDVFLISLDLSQGSEIKKTRPALIVSDNSLGKLPLKVIVPITDWKDKYVFAPWMIKLEPNKQNGLIKDSSVDCFQVRSVSETRFIKKLGHVDDSAMDEIRIGLSKVLSINE